MVIRITLNSSLIFLRNYWLDAIDILLFHQTDDILLRVFAHWLTPFPIYRQSLRHSGNKYNLWLYSGTSNVKINSFTAPYCNSIIFPLRCPDRNGIKNIAPHSQSIPSVYYWGLISVLYFLNPIRPKNCGDDTKQKTTLFKISMASDFIWIFTLPSGWHSALKFEH